MPHELYNPQENNLPAKTNPNQDRLLAESGMFAQNGAEKTMKITNFGQIESFILPEGWLAVPQAKGVIGKLVSLEFKQSNNAALSLREKGQRISEEAGKLFVNALGKNLDAKTQDRLIDLTGEAGRSEYAALSPVLAETLANANRFKPETVCIREINGRRVLEVIGMRGNVDDKGIWISTDQKIASLYIDKFGKGDAIQEIRLEANEKSFGHLKTEFEKALKSLKWKKEAQ